MITKYIITGNGNLRRQRIRQKVFNENYAPVSRIGNTIIYQKKSRIRTVKVTKKKKIRTAIPKRVAVPIRKEKPISQRIRRQIVMNYRLDEPPYFNSVRAMTLNPEYTEQALLHALMIYVNEQERIYPHIKPFRDYIGMEMVPIGDNEDASLNDMKIHIEVMDRRKTHYFTEK